MSAPPYPRNSAFPGSLRKGLQNRAVSALHVDMASRTREQVKLESVRNLRARWRAESRILVQADLPGELVAAIDRLKDDAGLRGRAPIIEEALRFYIEAKQGT